MYDLKVSNDQISYGTKEHIKVVDKNVIAQICKVEASAISGVEMPNFTTTPEYKKALSSCKDLVRGIVECESNLKLTKASIVAELSELDNDDETRPVTFNKMGDEGQLLARLAGGILWHVGPATFLAGFKSKVLKKFAVEIGSRRPKKKFNQAQAIVSKLFGVEVLPNEDDDNTEDEAEQKKKKKAAKKKKETKKAATKGDKPKKQRKPRQRKHFPFLIDSPDLEGGIQVGKFLAREELSEILHAEFLKRVLPDCTLTSMRAFCIDFGIKGSSSKKRKDLVKLVIDSIFMIDEYKMLLQYVKDDLEKLLKQSDKPEVENTNEMEAENKEPATDYAIPDFEEQTRSLAKKTKKKQLHDHLKVLTSGVLHKFAMLNRVKGHHKQNREGTQTLVTEHFMQLLSTTGPTPQEISQTALHKAGVRIQKENFYGAWAVLRYYAKVLTGAHDFAEHPFQVDLDEAIKTSRDITPSMTKKLLADRLNALTKVFCEIQTDTKKSFTKQYAKFQVGGKKKKPKDPTKPKNARTPYNFYCKNAYEKFKVENPGKKMTEITQLIAANWRSLTDKEKAPYVAMNQEDRKRWEIETTAWKKEQAPKKPLCGFLRYYQQVRESLKEQHPDKKITELSVIAGKKWKTEVTMEEKAKFNQDYLKEKEAHAIEYAKWKAKHDAKLKKQESEKLEALDKKKSKKKKKTNGNAMDVEDEEVTEEEG